jgi:Tfp pilus assembly protein PilV
MQLKVRPLEVSPGNRRLAVGKSTEMPIRRASGGFTLVEVLIAAGIMGLVFGGVINCYIQSGVRIEWTGYSLAAQSLASEVLEQTRSASWDPAQSIPVNNLTNMNLQAANYDSSTRTYTGYTTSVLDVPYSGTNTVPATNYITVQMVYVNGDPKVQMQFIQVNTVWPFYYRRGNQCYTNTISTMVGPDDRQI